MSEEYVSVCENRVSVGLMGWINYWDVKTVGGNRKVVFFCPPALLDNDHIMWSGIIEEDIEHGLGVV